MEHSATRRNMFYKYFCSNGCYNDFANANIDRIRLPLRRRTEALETPINDPTKNTESYYGGWDITERGIDNTTE